MATVAAYDDIADWYEHEFLPRSEPGDPLGIKQALRTLLGTTSQKKLCLEIGCGTGTHAAAVRELGWTPVGVDISSAMLRHARGRLATARADATRLPLADASVPAVIAVMVHTDIPDFPRVLAEAARILRPDGVFVHVGVHPCFCGGFADRSDPEAVVIRPGYLDSRWTKESWTSEGVRDKVGASHFPLAQLLHAFLDAGLVPDRFMEGGSPTPTTLSIRARPRTVGR
jgi:SAM-dependent methyltransferase